MMSSSSIITSNSTTINSIQQINMIIKKYKQHLKQLNILLEDTMNSYKELKQLEQDNMTADMVDVNDDVVLNDIKAYYNKTKHITLVICNAGGGGVFAQSIICNDLLGGRQFIPISQLINGDAKWKVIKIKYGKLSNMALQLVDGDFELMQDSSCNISSFDLNINDIDRLSNQNGEDESMIIEITLNTVTIDCKLLETGVDIILLPSLKSSSSSSSSSSSLTSIEYLLSNTCPIFIVPITSHKLNEKEIKEFSDLKNVFKTEAIFFVKIPDFQTFINEQLPSSTTTNTEFEYLKYIHSSHQSSSQQNNFYLFKQLCDLSYLNILPTSTNLNNKDNVNNNNNENNVDNDYEIVVDNEFCEKYNQFLIQFSVFLKKKLRAIEIKLIKNLFKFHEKCLQKFILRAYDMARDLIFTPRKLEYAKDKEFELYEQLNQLTMNKQDEFKQLIQQTLVSNKIFIVNMVNNYEFVNIEFQTIDNTNHVISSSTSSLNSNDSTSLDDSSDVKRYREGTLKYAKDIKRCTQQIHDLVITKINQLIAQQITNSIEILKESYIGTLKRCLGKLEFMDDSNNASLFDASISSDDKSSTSSNNCQFNGDNESASASEALKQILNSAYQFDVTLTTSSNLIIVLIERMKELLSNMPWNTSPKIDSEWKITISINMLSNLNESKLAKLLCNQMRDRLKTSHNSFIASLKLLEVKHNGRLEKTEELQQKIRKNLAPKFARLCLESTSLNDYILYGMPQLGKEIGRGQYGVVYNCAKWGKYTHLAVKSVVPPDDKHWNDLALEFHYTKQISDHEHIVKLLGSVIDYSYGNGLSPAVLLIMEGMKRDLYTALKAGLDFVTRLQISLDVVKGIRYLHGRGLVHRDIKLKNVLLDSNNRAKITDLGFCKPEAMMSGSIVGTPVHMSPEIFNSKYDNSVDIYAFGILFWYICAGHVRLPQNFEQCTSKDDLWSTVKRGKRPERVSTFDDDCWLLMENCWNHVPKERPHIGEVYSFLNKIYLKYKC